MNRAADEARHLEEVIGHVRAWMSKNMLKLNTNKTELLVISDKKHLEDLKEVRLNVGNDIISPVNSARNIGVIFDSTLSLVPHITSSARSAMFHLHNIGKIRKYLSQDAAAQLVHSLVTSRLDYGNALLTNMPACHLQKLQHVQNVAARIVTRAGRWEHTTPILQALHWLPIQARIEYKVAYMVYKALNNQAPDYIQEMLSPYLPSRTLRSSKAGFLIEPIFRTKQYGARSFSVAAPRIWNALPANLRLCDPKLFTSHLKTYLFRKYYS